MNSNNLLSEDRLREQLKVHDEQQKIQILSAYFEQGYHISPESVVAILSEQKNCYAFAKFLIEHESCTSIHLIHIFDYYVSSNEIYLKLVLQQKKITVTPEEYTMHKKRSFSNACSHIPDTVDKISIMQLILNNCSSLMTSEHLNCFYNRLIEASRTRKNTEKEIPYDIHNAMLQIVQHPNFKLEFRKSDLSPNVIKYILLTPHPFYFAATAGWMDIFMHFYLKENIPDEARNVAFLMLHKHGHDNLINQFAFDQFKLFGENKFVLFIAIALTNKLCERDVLVYTFGLFMNSVCSEIVSSLTTTGTLPEIYKNKKVTQPTLFAEVNEVKNTALSEENIILKL